MSLPRGWKAFSPEERRNLTFYIIGIMFYKVGLEVFLGSMINLIVERYEVAVISTHDRPDRTFQRAGLFTGLLAAGQCLGSILISPLIRRFRTTKVLAMAITIFGTFTTIILVVEGTTGGTFPIPDHLGYPMSQTGRYNTDYLLPAPIICSVTYGMVELIRRIIPRDIVGGDIHKLRRMDSFVHIFYTLAGFAGCLITPLVLILKFGSNFAPLVTPPLFVIAGISWSFIRLPNDISTRSRAGSSDLRSLVDLEPGYFRATCRSMSMFFGSVYHGAKIVFTHRKFIWLLPCYALALYAHRYLENGIAPVIGKRYLTVQQYSMILVAGSNLGECLGALVVFIFIDFIPTPIPWLRIDALFLLVIWYLAFWYPWWGANLHSAFLGAAFFMPISFGWAAGDVSLAAYIQASLTKLEGEDTHMSVLSSVMSFLYCTYIVIYAIASPLLGAYVDRVWRYENWGRHATGRINHAIVYVGGWQYTILAVLIFAATFIPRGSLALNPKMLFDEKLEEVDEDDGLEMDKL